MAHSPLSYNSRNTGLALSRLAAFPIDKSTLWDKVGSTGKLLWHDPAWGDDTTQDVEVSTTQELASKYAACSIAYAGQIIGVVDPSTGVTDVYKIDDSGDTKVAVKLSTSQEIEDTKEAIESSENDENYILQFKGKTDLYFSFKPTAQKTETIKVYGPFSIWINWDTNLDYEHYVGTEKQWYTITHTYSSGGSYNCYIRGVCRDISVYSEADDPSSLYAVVGDLSDLHIEMLGHSGNIGVNKSQVGAFENCSNMSYFTIPSDCYVIGYNCFKNCSSMTNIAFIANKTSLLNRIYGAAFSGCSNLTSINFSTTNMTHTEPEFLEGSSISVLRFPVDFVSVGEYIYGEDQTQTKLLSLQFVGDMDYMFKQSDLTTFRVYTAYGYDTTYKYYDGTTTSATETTKDVYAQWFVNKTDRALYNLISTIQSTMVTASDVSDDEVSTVSLTDDSDSTTIPVMEIEI